MDTVEPGEINITIEACDPDLLVALRSIDGQVAKLQAESQALCKGYAAGKGWITELHDVKIDLQSGSVQIMTKPKPDVQPVPIDT